MKTGTPFDQYSHQHILAPLNMNASTWKLDEAMKNHPITYYNERYRKLPPYSIITYPDGGLYSSVSDMTTYLQEMMKGYNGGSKLFGKETFRQMMKIQDSIPNSPDGICWDLSFEGLIGHAGNDFGTTTLIYFSPETGIGRILFSNISIETEKQEACFYGVYNTLFEDF